MKMYATNTVLFTVVLLSLSGAVMSDQTQAIRALLVDGQMNKHHNMEVMSESVTGYLEETGLFEVTRVSTPPPGADMSGFAPNFENFDVVVLNYDGDSWPETTQAAFESFISGGGGLVTVHSTDNAFPKWPAFLEMTGVGGWGGRDETWGPAVYWGDNGIEYDHGPGAAFHPPQHEFPVTIRNGGHPVTEGLSMHWMHGKDELYSGLRGPAKNLEVLATGFADESLENTSGRHEPVLMALAFGEGRIFHTTLGHVNRNATAAPASIQCAGFITTLQRGAEWAATGNVSQEVPDDFPAGGKLSIRP